MRGVVLVAFATLTIGTSSGCRKRIVPGGACQNDIDCVAAEHCVSGTCTKRAEVGPAATLPRPSSNAAKPSTRPSGGPRREPWAPEAPRQPPEAPKPAEPERVRKSAPRNERYFQPDA